MKNVVYGMLKSALLFHWKLKKDSQIYGFETNPYDPCVAKKTAEDMQHTVIWHVENLHASHKNLLENIKLALYLSYIYGEKLTIHRERSLITSIWSLILR